MGILNNNRNNNETPRYKKAAKIENLTIGIFPDNSVELLIDCRPYTGNVMPFLRDKVAPRLGLQVDPRWNTHQLGSKLVDFINGGGDASSNSRKYFRIIYHYWAIPRGLVVEADTVDEAMRKARDLIRSGRDHGRWEETETEECFDHMSIEQAIIDEDDRDDYPNWDWIGDTKHDIESWKGERYENIQG